MVLTIRKEDPAAPDIVALLETHLDLMRSTSPPESVHALDIEALRQPDITFWTARSDGALLGCGAIKALNAAHGEIKSMHVLQTARMQGIGVALVESVLAEARERGYSRLSLETGSTDHFKAARQLYTRFGFTECGPFECYVEDWHSTFMTREL